MCLDFVDLLAACLHLIRYYIIDPKTNSKVFIVYERTIKLTFEPVNFLLQFLHRPLGELSTSFSLSEKKSYTN